MVVLIVQARCARRCLATILIAYRADSIKIGVVRPRDPTKELIVGAKVLDSHRVAAEEPQGERRLLTARRMRSRKRSGSSAANETIMTAAKIARYTQKPGMATVPAAANNAAPTATTNKPALR